MDHGPPAQPSLWWRIPLRVKGVVLLVVPLTALFVALFAVYTGEGEVQESDHALAGAYEIRSELAELRASLLDAQTAMAAYVGAPEDRFLVLFDAARRRAGDSQSKLVYATRNDPLARSVMGDIRRHTAAVMDRFEAVRNSRQPAGLEASAAARADLQSRIVLLSDFEDGRFRNVRTRRDQVRSRLIRTLFLCAVLGPLGAVLIHFLATGRMVRRLRLVEANARRLADGHPLKPAQAGSDEVAILGQQLERAAFLLSERERKRREGEERYRDLFERAPVPFEEIDANGTARRVNQAACTLLRSPAHQLIGRPVWSLVASGEQEDYRTAMMERLTSGSEVAPFECEYQFEDGAHITVEVRENLIHNEQGEVTGAVRSLLDVTERNLASIAARKVSQYAMELRIKNEQLARALEGARSATVAKSRFLASVSHELRTPLNGIIGFSELLYDQKIGPLTVEQRDVLSDVLASSRHLLQLINDILDLTKIEAGRMEFQPERHRIADLVTEVRDVVRPLAEKKKLGLTLDVPAELVAQVDGARFKQVVYNYLSNAVKFTPEGGSVAVSVRAESAESFRLEVKDSGIGIEAGELGSLFQEFGQLPNSRRAGQGTGLGLALTRHLVEAQGGSVGVESCPGQGSVFFAVLPVEAQASPAVS